MKQASLMSRLAVWFRAVTFRRRFELDMDEEIGFHMEQHAAALMARGVPSAEAHRQARIAFGGTESSRHSIRSAIGLRPFDELFGDLRYAMRVLRNSPGFTTIAATSLALAIGANTTIFSVAHFLLIERLGVPHASELRMLYREDPKRSVYHSNWGTWIPGDRDFKIRDAFSYPVYQQMQRDARKQGVEIFAFKDIGTVDAAFSGQAQAVQAELVSGDFYEQMQTIPAQGRGVQPSDDGAPGTGTVVVLSYGFWQRAFGGSPDVLGKVIRIDTIPFTIVGVNAPGFTGAQSVQRAAELTLPMSVISLLHAPVFNDEPSLLQSPGDNWIQLLLRKPSGFSDAALQQRLDVLFHTAVLATVTPKAGEGVPRLMVQDGSRGIAQWSRQMREPLHVLLGLVACVLLLACANVANLMLARANHRRREISIRLALGAGRARVFRQLLVESMALAVLGGAAGIVLGYLGTRAAPALLYSGWVNNPAPVPFQMPALVFTTIVTLLTGVLFGVVPALESTRTEVNTALKQGARSASRQRKAWTGKGLVAFQIALATLLVAGSALFIRTMVNLANVDPGFDPHDLLIFDVQLPNRQYAGARSLALHQQLVRRVAALPGVDGVSAISVPLVGNSVWTTGLRFDWEPKQDFNHPDISDRDVDLNDVSPGFFSLMRIPILSGRDFIATDTTTSPRVAIVNQSFVRAYLPGRSPLGVRFSGGDGERKVDGKILPNWLTIVGVCADTQYSDLRSAPRPMYITDKFQKRDFGKSSEGSSYVLRSRLTKAVLAPTLTRTLADIDPGLPLIDVRTQMQQIEDASSQERLFATLTAGFGVLSLALACVGIYGVMAYTVSQRTHEIGIRLALGAERRQVRGMVLQEATYLTAIGIIAGVGAALGLARLVGSLLYRIEPRDPLSLILSAALLLTVALSASWLPAARAARLEPVIALRQD